MTIFSYFNVWTIFLVVNMTILALYLLKKAGLINSIFDPFIQTHFQIIFTTILLSIAGFFPFDQLLYITFTYIVLTVIWKNKYSNDLTDQRYWWLTILILIAASILSNIYLIQTKGFILFADDVGAAKVEYYQGYGIFKRINAILGVLLPVHVFKEWLEKRRWNNYLTCGLAYSIFLILCSGSKSGILSLAFAYGTVLYFYKTRCNPKIIFLCSIILVLSSFAMFYLVYGNLFLLSFYNRFIAFADGPFYFFSDKMHINVPFTYPLHILGYSSKLIDHLPTTSLGPEINWQYFRLDNELYGPNPQISVESVAIYGNAALIHYLTYLVFALCFTRFVRSPYSFAIYTTFLRSFPIDSQLAYSNIVNIVIIGFIYCISVVLTKMLSNLTRKQLDSYISQ